MCGEELYIPIISREYNWRRHLELFVLASILVVRVLKACRRVN
jgi:hypothetical protein